jgi:DNA repair exonuclease SbcCD nuclease subunit
MAIKIFHTADLHLGMRFAGYPEIQNELINARYETLEKMVAIANKEECDLFVIAGDLFDRVTVKAKEISMAVKILNEFNGELVIVLPGNHDYYTSDSSLWENFSQLAGDRILVLKEPKIYDLSNYHLDAVVFGCPCSSKHSAENMLGWIKSNSINSDLLKIGIAHGSLEGVSPDFDKTYYPMTNKELESIGLDLWLLGHTHLPWPERPDGKSRVFISGTPEPDGFDCKHEGSAYIIKIESPSKRKVQRIVTGKYRFLIKQILLHNEDSIKRMEDEYCKEEYQNTILRLILKGRLKKEELTKVKEATKSIGEKVLYLEVIQEELNEEITSELINSEFTQDSFPHQLLLSLLKEEEDVSTKALQKAYDMIREIKNEN